MSETDFEAMKDDVIATLAKNESGDGMGGEDVTDLMDAMSHPKAAGVVQELMALEPNTVQPGEPAPDFTLPRLSGSAADGSASVTLSDHFGNRPVALIFGSYT